jgi:soluble lytic murein transglycosylase
MQMPKQARIAAGGVVTLVLVSLAATGFVPALPAGQNGTVQPSDLWLVPASAASDGAPGLAEVVSLVDNGEPADALRALETAAFHPDLAGYARLYEGRALAALERHADALRVAESLLGDDPRGHLREAALWLKADAAEAAERWPDAAAALDALVALDTSRRVEALLRLGQAAGRRGDTAAAQASYARLYFEFPATSQAAEAGKALSSLKVPLAPTAVTWALSFERAERLFSAGRCADARKDFAAVRGLAAAEMRGRIDLRLAQCDVQLRRYPAAHDAFAAIAAAGDSADLVREAGYHALGTLRALGREAEYVREVGAFVGRHADHPLAETALNDLGTHYILANEDGKAAEVFRDMYARHPAGAFADRAAWKAGWWSYKSGDYAEAIRIFESAAVGLRRANYRPSWLYWAARAHGRLGHRDAAADGYRRTIADYRNSYYGRQAARELERLLEPLRPAGAGPVAPASLTLPPTIDPGPAPANTAFVQRLLAAGLYDAAASELRVAQRELGAPSPRIEATVAYALNRLGQLRPAITAMRRAYPQFMASGGEALPAEILTVIFPVDHWDLIRRHAAAHQLDPYLMAALIAQESTFQADIRSSANAWGLMQIIPSTGRRYAQRLRIRPFSTWRLTEPEVNVRIGMTYFAELLRQFGDPAPALAAYNAGENRVARWLAERPGIDRDEFIDDIPFPETQNYVKRVLGTAEDYRLLYGGAPAAGDAAQR